MIGYGILALLGLGVAMSAGGGSDDADIEPIQDDQDTGDTPDLLNPIDVELQTPDDLDAEYEQRVDDFIADLIAEPGLSAAEANAKLEAFLAELEAERAGDTPVEEPPVAEEPTLEPPTVEPPADPTEEVERPPLIDDERNPFNRPENDLPPVAESDPDAEPDPTVGPTPDPIPTGDLVTVTTVSGTELTDSSVISEGPTSGEDADRDYVVTTGSTPTEIEVGYDSQTTFLIDYSEQTDTISASLNSDLEGHDGTRTISEASLTDDSGTDYTEITTTQYFRGATEITMNVDQAQIGNDVSRIDLTNPTDTLTFNFAPDVTGNMHLIYSDVETDDGNDSSTVRTLYVVQTTAAITSLTPTQVGAALAQGDASGFALLAEIYLGEDSVTVDGNPGSGQPYEVSITNFINDNPRVEANTGWTSISEIDGLDPDFGDATPPADEQPDTDAPIVTPEFFGF